MESTGNNHALDYWKQQLRDAPTRLNLPTDYSRSVEQSFQGATISFKIPPNLAEDIKTLSRREGITLSVLLLTALKILIFRYTHQEDLLVGSLNGQGDRVVPHVPISLLDALRLLRTDLSGQPSFRELLERVRNVTLVAHDHQDFSLKVLGEELQRNLSISPIPLIQVLFGFHKLAGTPINQDFLADHHLGSGSPSIHFDLALLVSEDHENLTGSITYNANLFEASTIDRMIGHFVNIVTAIAAQPDDAIDTLPLLTPAEQHQLLVEWNATGQEYPKGKCIHHVFEEQVEKTPDNVAVAFSGQHFTYRQLNMRANQLAHYLRQRGVGPDVLVGICMERSLEMVVGLLGILKAGGAYIPLDPNYPPARLAHMIEDSAPPFLLTQGRLAEKLPLPGTRVVALDTQWNVLSGESTENPRNHVSPDHLAYVIYTSGSTGGPKGVEIPHGAIANHMFWLQREFSIDHSDRILQKTPFSFDASVWEFYAPLLAGGQLIMAKPDGHRDGDYLVRAIIENEITILQLVPSQLQLLLATPDVSRCRSLRNVFCGGEPLTATLINQLYQHLPTVILHNLYGPSEAAIDTTFWACKPLPEKGSVPIGRPIANVQTYILDSHLQPVPIGVSAELYIGGAGVGRGYRNLPNLTSERFIPNPFSADPTARLYRTGDLASYLSDGTIRYHGRIDHQVKIRGNRVELGEIESTMAKHPAIREVVVNVYEFTPDDKRLAAYIVPNPQARFHVSKVREFLAARLPEYMVPATFVLIDRMPLSANGKVNRQALPEPNRARPDLTESYVAPRSPTEQTLAGIWEQVIGLDNIGINDNFLELGGDSILSIQITSRANQAGLNLTPNQILQYQTIATLAAAAEKNLSNYAEQGVITGSVPLTPIQKRFLEQDILESSVENQTLFLKLRQTLDPFLLEEALRQLLIQHDMLRVRITRDGSTWHQNITAPEMTVSFFHEKYSGLTVEEQETTLNAVAATLQARLDLSRVPVLTTALIDFGPDESGCLILIIPRIAVDLVSWGILLEDLERLYHQLSQGQPLRLLSKTTSYKSWAQQLAAAVQSKEFHEELPFWIANTDIESAHLPAEPFAGAGHPIEPLIDIVSVGLNSEDTAAFLTEVPKAYRMISLDVLLSALVDAFSSWTGRTSLQIDLEDEARESIFDQVDISRTVGCFSAIYPVLLDLDGLTNPHDKLMAVKELLRSIPHAGIGYGMLRYMSAEEETIQKLQGLPQAEVSFHYMGSLDDILSPDSIFQLAEDFFQPNWNPKKKPAYRMQIKTYVLQGRLRVAWAYRRNEYQQATIERLASSFLEAVKNLIDHCKSPAAGRYTPSDFPEADLSQQDLDDLLNEINDLER